jgi:hypothetical protein
MTSKIRRRANREVRAFRKLPRRRWKTIEEWITSLRKPADEVKQNGGT